MDLSVNIKVIHSPLIRFYIKMFQFVACEPDVASRINL